MTDTEPGFTPRHWIVLTALINWLVALYLHLWKIGAMGSLSCNKAHSCEFVMTSQWSYFLGVDVALIGVVGYTLFFITAFVGTLPGRSGDRRITMILTALTAIAFLFTARLKYYEWFVMHAFCKWCFISATTVTTYLIAVVLDRQRVRERPV